MTDKFIPSTQFIEKLPNICVDLELVSVYDMDCYSVPQLLYRLAQKINDTITNMEHNDEALKAHLEDLQVKLEYLLGEGLMVELQKIFEKMYADGTLQSLVEGAMVDINKKLEDLKAENVSQEERLDDIANNKLPAITGQLDNIENKTKKVAYLDMYENYKEGEDWKKAIEKLFQDNISFNSIEIVLNKEKNYKTSGNITTNKRVKFTGVSPLTILEFIGVGNFITVICERQDYIFNTKNITILNSGNGSIGVFVQRGTVDNVKWGAKFNCENTVIRGFLNEQLLCVGAYLCYAKQCDFTGTGTLTNSKGVKLTANYKNLKSFGNNNRFENCTFNENRIGLELEDVMRTKATSCTFEPNYININAYKTNENGVAMGNVIDSCWIEDYTGTSHRECGAYSIYPLDNMYNEIKDDNRVGEILCFNTSIHSTCVIPRGKNGGMTYSPKGGYTNFSKAQLIGVKDRFIEYGNSDEPLFYLDIEEQYTKQSNTKIMKLSAKNIATNTIVKECMYNYLENPHADKNQTFVHTIDLNQMNFTINKVKLFSKMNVQGGNKAIFESEITVCKSLDFTKCTTKVLSDIQNTGNDLSGNKGVNIEFNPSTNVITIYFGAIGLIDLSYLISYEMVTFD